MINCKVYSDIKFQSLEMRSSSLLDPVVLAHLIGLSFIESN